MEKYLFCKLASYFSSDGSVINSSVAHVRSFVQARIAILQDCCAIFCFFFSHVLNWKLNCKFVFGVSCSLINLSCLNCPRY